jgi:hypothetical protein
LANTTIERPSAVSSASEAKDYFSNLKNNTIEVIDKDNQADILLAFSKEKINDRKIWLSNYNININLDIGNLNNITIGDFLKC